MPQKLAILRPLTQEGNEGPAFAFLCFPGNAKRHIPTAVRHAHSRCELSGTPHQENLVHVPRSSSEVVASGSRQASRSIRYAFFSNFWHCETVKDVNYSKINHFRKKPHKVSQSVPQANAANTFQVTVSTASATTRQKPKVTPKGTVSTPYPLPPGGARDQAALSTGRR